MRKKTVKKSRIKRKSFKRPQKGFEKIKGLFVMAVLLVGVGITVYVSQSRVTTQQRASGVNVPTPINGKTPPCANYGDATGDKVITSDDAVKVNNFVAGTIRMTALEQGWSDVDADGKITATDALFISKYATGADSSLPLCAKVTRSNPKVCGNYGDVNNDGLINALDAHEVAKYTTGLVSLITAGSYEQYVGDVNGSLAADITDSLLIARYAEGRTSTFAMCAKTKQPPSQSVCSFAKALGEVDGDGLVTELDGRYVVGHSIGLSPITNPDKLKNADANNDGKLDAIDGLLIARYAFGFDTIFKACTATSTPVPSPTPAPKPLISGCGKYGDVDMDNQISMNDATEIARYVTGLPKLGPVNIMVGDVDGNEKIEMVDALYIGRYLTNQSTMLAGVKLSDTPSLPICVKMNPPLPTTPTPIPVCGDRVCSPGETAQSCGRDCTQ